MIDKTIDIIVKPILNFLAKHSPFIIGLIINFVLIYASFKIIDAFEHRLINKLKEKNSESPLFNMMPVLTRITKSLIVLMLLAGFLQSFGYNVSSLQKYIFSAK